MKIMNKKKGTENTVSYGVIGLGRFGSALARRLAEAGEEVIVVDCSESKVKELRQYTENAYVADELSKEVLEEIGIQNCDTVIVGIGEKNRHLHTHHAECSESGCTAGDCQGD